MPDPPEDPRVRRIAAALGYDPARKDAPRVVARGHGEIADRIIALAREHDVPIRGDGVLRHLVFRFV